MKYNLFSGLFYRLICRTKNNKIEIDDAWDWKISWKSNEHLFNVRLQTKFQALSRENKYHGCAITTFGIARASAIELVIATLHLTKGQSLPQRHFIVIQVEHSASDQNLTAQILLIKRGSRHLFFIAWLV